MDAETIGCKSLAPAVLLELGLSVSQIVFQALYFYQMPMASGIEFLFLN